MNVLLSIKPEFAEKILSKEKRYEFRKTRFSDPSAVEFVLMYASAPVQRIVGTFTFNNIIEESPEQLWTDYGSVSGMDKKSRFMDYFSGTDPGYAIEINDPRKLSSPIDPTQQFDNFRPPVSFKYTNGDYGATLNSQSISASGD